jgi:hypothetical protein
MAEEVEDEAPLPEWTDSMPHVVEDMAEADYVSAQEESELQQLIAAMEQQEQENDAASQHFGSDDEDYDQLFMECAATVYQQQHQHQGQHNDFGSDDMDAMDMDMTDG